MMTKKAPEKNIYILGQKLYFSIQCAYLRPKIGSVFLYTLWSPSDVNSYHVVPFTFQKFGY